MHEHLSMIMLDLVGREDKAKSKVNHPDCLIVAYHLLASIVLLSLGQQEILENRMEIEVACNNFGDEQVNACL